MHWTLMDLMWIGIVIDSTILMVHELIHTQICLITEDNRWKLMPVVNCSRAHENETYHFVYGRPWKFDKIDWTNGNKLYTDMYR